MNDEETYLRNMRAEIAFTQKSERERERTEVITESDDIIITSKDYSKSTYIVPGLEPTPIFKKVKK